MRTLCAPGPPAGPTRASRATSVGEAAPTTIARVNSLRPHPSPAARGRAAGIVLAGGSGTRVGAGMNKAFLPLSGRSIASWGINALGGVDGVSTLVFVVRAEDQELARTVVERETDHPVEIVTGGDTRQESELLALRHLADRIDADDVRTVLIHDAARPLVSHGLAAAVLHAAERTGGAVPALPAQDLVPIGPGQHLEPEPGDAGALLRVQTPQAFRADTILDAYEAAARDGFVGTDTASCAQQYTDIATTWVRGEETNFKITYAQDLLLAQDVVAALRLRTG